MSASCPFSLRRAENNTSHADSLTFGAQLCCYMSLRTATILFIYFYFGFNRFYHITLLLLFLFSEAHIYIYSNPSCASFSLIKAVIYLCVCAYRESQKSTIGDNAEINKLCRIKSQRTHLHHNSCICGPKNVMEREEDYKSQDTR